MYDYNINNVISGFNVDINFSVLPFFFFTKNKEAVCINYKYKVTE